MASIRAENALNYGDILLYLISTYQLFIDTVIWVVLLVKICNRNREKLLYATWENKFIKGIEHILRK